MTIKIIGAGYGRTGTMSTQHALNLLGFPCYHMVEVMKNKGHLDFWLKVARSADSEQHEWNPIFNGYSAVIDNPASCVWRELHEHYPDAKVLLTLHPKGADAWYESTIDTIYFTENKWQFKVVEFFTPFGRKIGEMSNKLVWRRAHKDTMPDRAAAVAEYQNRIEEVKAAIPAEQLLIFTVDMGWEPLCEFLGVDVPQKSFPNVNDRAQMKKTLQGIDVLAYGLLSLTGIGIVGLSYSISAFLV